MNDEIIQEKLISCIKNTCIYEGEIKLQDKIKNNLGYDSLDIVSLICEIESTFKITFNSSDLTLDNMKTVKDLFLLIKRTLSNEIN